MNTYGSTGTIPIPTYLFDDKELCDLIDRIEEVSVESESLLTERDKAAISAIEAELRRRAKPIRQISA